MWREVVARVSPYRLTLQNLYAEVESRLGPEKSKLTQAFAKRLREEYPGSYYVGGMYGQLAINDYTKLGFDSHWNITVLSQRFGSLSKVYNFRQKTLEISNGPNKIGIRFDLRYPAHSRFTQATIPALSVTAKNLWLRKGARQAYPSPLRDILNDVYDHKIADENGIRMDQLAENMINNKGTRYYVLKDAEELYRNSGRGGANKDRTTRRVSADKPTSEALPVFSPYAVLTLFFWPGIIAIAILGVITFATRHLRTAHNLAWRKFKIDLKSPNFEKIEQQGDEGTEFSF